MENPKKSSSRKIGMIVLLSLLTFFGWLVLQTSQVQGKALNLASPILGVSMSLAENIWSPKDASESSFLRSPDITGETAFFVDVNTGQVLYEKNAQLKRPIASLTKLMSVIITLDNRTFNSQFTVSQKAADTEPDKMYLQAGEKLTVQELLDGIFLVSANDAAEVLAENTTGNREEFIKLMNIKAAQLGMNDTKFINPTGLEEDPPEGQTESTQMMQYSTAYDVALMARYLVNKWPQVTDISSNPHIFIDRNDTHQDYDLYSGINLVTTYPGVLGLKTGYTPEAGLTLVTLAKRGDHEILGVLLNAPNRREDARDLLDYAFSKLK